MVAERFVCSLLKKSCKVFWIYQNWICWYE